MGRLGSRYRWSVGLLSWGMGLGISLAICRPSASSAEPAAANVTTKEAEPSWPKNPHVAETPHLSPEQEREKLHLPPGFEIQLVAAEPEINKPMNMAFDHRGRLWVTCSVEYPFPAKNEASARDTIKILEDTDGDGRADKIITFADHLSIPIGILPMPDGAIVWSIPSIYRLTDTNGDDRADKKEVLFEGFGYADNHGMINGMTWGFDGWIYLCHGFANTSKTKGKDGHTIEMHSGNTWRFRTDGSRVEYVTHGQVNPFGLCFDPLGNIYTADCHSKPMYQLLRGAWYPSFGKPHDGLGYGPVMCEHAHGSTAICGIVFYAADQFPPEWHGTVFIGNVVTTRVNHDKVKWHGSTPVAIKQPDFIQSDDPWFRPVDFQLGPDGTLYIADFYNRIIGHYEVPLTHPGRDRTSGRIWRIVYTGKGAKPARQPRADWSKATVTELVEDLGHVNLWVRTQATNQLVQRVGQKAVAPVRSAVETPRNAFQKLHGLWTLERLEALEEKTLLAGGKDSDREVRIHVQRILSEREAWSEAARALAVAALEDSDACVQRAAADALGRHPRPAQLRPLLDLRERVPKEDTHLLHVVRMAIRDHFRLPESWDWLAKSGKGRTDRACAADVAVGLDTAASADFLFDYIQHVDGNETEDKARIHHITRFLAEDKLTSFLSLVRNTSYSDLGREVGRLRALNGGLQKRGMKLNDETKVWAEDVADRLLGREDEARIKQGIELIRKLRLKSYAGRLKEMVLGTSISESIREAACEALATLDAGAAVSTLGRILADGRGGDSMRRQAVRLLGGIRKSEAVETLSKQLRSSPQRLAVKIAAALAASKEGGERLLAEAESGKASPRLLLERDVKNHLSRQGIEDLGKRVLALTGDLPPADDRIQQMIKARKEGFPKAKPDLSLGAKVFEEKCGVCHKIGTVGEKVGPELDGVGIRGVDRLLEDVLDPSRNVDQAFRSTILLLDSNLIRTGLLQSDDGEALVLVDREGKAETIPKDEVVDRKTSNLSPMPADWGETIAEEEFYNLLAYLLAQTQNDAPAVSR